jgi:hypothetical protein
MEERLAMPFVVFRNSKGRGLVIPDGLGGTKLVYLMPETSDVSLDASNSFEYQGEVFVEDFDADRVLQGVEVNAGSHELPSLNQ